MNQSENDLVYEKDDFVAFIDAADSLETYKLGLVRLF